jgi:hypothetical protein
MSQTGQAVVKSRIPVSASAEAAAFAGIDDPVIDNLSNNVFYAPALDEPTRTHRCRLFRLAANVLPGRDLFTEFWDSEEDPREPIDLPASAELVERFTGSSLLEVRTKLDAHRSQHGNYFRGDWSLRGSI